MKKLLFLLICTTTLGLVSCKKDTLEPSARTIILNIQPNQWVRSADGHTVTAMLDIPEVDGRNVDIEGILVYLDHPVEESSYIQLPKLFGGAAYSYEHLEGGINIDIQSPNPGFDPDPFAPTVPIRVKVVLIPSVDIT